MAQYFVVHPTNPQKRLIRKAADFLRGGGLIAYPTDSCYALGCQIGNAQALERLRALSGIDERHHLTLMCRDLSEIAHYAIVDDARFMLLKRVTQQIRGGACRLPVVDRPNSERRIEGAQQALPPHRLLDER